jgi:hypothetical protein
MKYRKCRTVFDKTLRTRTDRSEAKWADAYWSCHLQALDKPTYTEKAILGLIKSVATYCDTHASANGTVMAADGYASEYILDMMKGIIGLLSADTGKRLDCGTLERTVRDIAEQAGFNRDLTE